MRRPRVQPEPGPPGAVLRASRPGRAEAPRTSLLPRVCLTSSKRSVGWLPAPGRSGPSFSVWLVQRGGGGGGQIRWREATSGWPVETRTLLFACPSRPRASRLFAGGRVVLARPSSPARHLGQTPSALGKRARGKVAVTRTWLPTDTGSCRVSERELRLDKSPGSARRGDH